VRRTTAVTPTFYFAGLTLYGAAELCTTYQKLGINSKTTEVPVFSQEDHHFPVEIIEICFRALSAFLERIEQF
jgi:hypothetical protein